jgi:hypothetical protein
MHFLRVRRQRRINYFGSDFARSYITQREHKPAWSEVSRKNGDRSGWAHIRGRFHTLRRETTHRRYVSVLHRAREKALHFLPLPEKQLIALFFESQEDPFVKQVIAKHCSARPELQHITERYLERIAKLKVFL